MKLEINEYIIVKTKTKLDVFGEVLYRVDETDIPCPDPFKQCKVKNDGIKFRMLAGTGLSAHRGLVIRDCAQNVNQNEADGITRKATKEEAEQFEKEHGRD